MLIKINSPAPVLNTPDFSSVFGGNTGSKIPLDEKGHPFHYEFVALEGAIFQVEKILPASFVYKISSPSYPQKDLFLDRRFTEPAAKWQIPKLPSAKIIWEKMRGIKGAAYVWGGNWSQGIPKIARLYPPQEKIDERLFTLWILKGVDCSGLLYEAAEGASPRNTHQLIHYGQPIENLSDLKPLDMIVYPGHVLFVFTSNTALESKSPYGVIETPLKERLKQIQSKRQFVKSWEPCLNPEKYFTVRRFVTYS